VMLSGAAADRAHDLLSPMRDLSAAVFFAFFGLSVAPSSLRPSCRRRSRSGRRKGWMRTPVRWRSG